MTKNQSQVKANIATVLIITGFACGIAAVTINAIIVLLKISWFGAAQLNNVDYWVDAYKQSPSHLFISLAFFIGGVIAVAFGAYLFSRTNPNPNAPITVGSTA